MARPQLYINVGQVLTVVVGGICAYEYIKLLQYEAGMTDQNLGDIILERVRNFRTMHQLW